MSNTLFEGLLNKGLISETSFEKLKNSASTPRISLHAEIRALLYLGVLLISSGIGVLVYKHIDQLGHLVIVGSLATACLACFGYCFWWRNSNIKTTRPSSALADYILLLGSILLLIVIGYLQTQFHFFGTRWGLASFIPMVLLFATAYYFDHKGVLSLAIINLAAWAGITINKGTWYGIKELNQEGTIITALSLSIFLVLLANIVKKRTVKPHFSAIYQQFGFHGLFLSSIAGIIHFDKLYIAWLFLLVLSGFYYLRKAITEKSNYFLVFSCLYVYAGLSYVFSAKIIKGLQEENEIYANLFYYLISGISVAFLLSTLNKKIKSDDRIS
ncbi:DUF2157 domain-containing protein [Flavihumibacter fluvii]|uniref:DUF2157 domain-containing protein n=1 Tax=Flavihumibacter fluvii TaxID=2838157 RepID=UPI001BDF2528|nr:DUF2157 domain-containing protein [Flavihumibacter fluvii]ULQ52355.1 DUF2157 domain-containing protein [Flavihumibacter fluvii]